MDKWKLTLLLTIEFNFQVIQFGIYDLMSKSYLHAQLVLVSFGEQVQVQLDTHLHVPCPLQDLNLSLKRMQCTTSYFQQFACYKTSVVTKPLRWYNKDQTVIEEAIKFQQLAHQLVILVTAQETKGVIITFFSPMCDLLAK